MRAPMFPGSSVVEQPAVNRLVAGSNPARGATLFLRHRDTGRQRTIPYTTSFVLAGPASDEGTDQRQC